MRKRESGVLRGWGGKRERTNLGVSVNDKGFKSPLVRRWDGSLSSPTLESHQDSRIVQAQGVQNDSRSPHECTSRIGKAVLLESSC